MSAFPESPFDRLLDELRFQAGAASRLAETLQAPVLAAVEAIEADLVAISEGIRRRWAPAFAIVSSELPKRGWYLTGEEPITLVGELADRIRNENWSGVDELLLEYVSQLKLDRNRLRDWLAQEDVPAYAIERISLVLAECEAQDHAAATIVGMATVDELCRHLYDGRDFTSKRSGRNLKPQIALATPSSKRRIGLFAKQFVQSFGMIHEDVDPRRLNDQDYFNRSAVVHGCMRRSYGPLDSAKVQMLFMFLIFGAEPLPER